MVLAYPARLPSKELLLPYLPVRFLAAFVCFTSNHHGVAKPAKQLRVRCVGQRKLQTYNQMQALHSLRWGDSHFSFSVQEDQKKSSGRHVKFLGRSPQRTTHPPYPPNTAPPGTKRVPICSFLNSASICIKRKYNKCVCKTLWVKNRFGASVCMFALRPKLLVPN